MAVKSTRTLGYNLKGTLDFKNLTLTEVNDEDVVVHDLEELLGKFDDQEITLAFNNKVKLEHGVE